MKTLNDTGELFIIEKIKRLLTNGKNVKTGPGDDCAVVSPGPGNKFDLLLTSDPVIEGTHFKRGTNPAKIGHKAAGRVLSDIAAMGGTPLWILVNIEAPKSCPVITIEKIFTGINSLAEKFSVSVIGGDLCSGEKLSVHTFAVGQTPRGKAILRSGAKQGDIIFVTGSLGGSRIKEKHLTFEPRVREGAFLINHATSCIDLSDGIASDLFHICRASGTGAMIDTLTIPLNPAIPSGTPRYARIRRALCDGEDFELLFTIPKNKEKSFLKQWKALFKLSCTRIGEMTSQPTRIKCRWEDGKTSVLKRKGYEHFKNKT